MKIQFKSWIKKFNNVVLSHPKLSLASFLIIRNVTWYTCFGIYNIGFSFGPELAIGYLVTKCTTKFRQPINLAFSACLIKLLPSLKDIQSKALVGILSPSDLAIPPLVATPSGNKFQYALEQFASKFHSSVEYIVNGPVNKYGFSMFLSARVTMLLSITSVSWIAYSGYDMSSTLVSFGISETIQSTGGAMAAATITNVMLLPMHLRFFPSFIPYVSKYSKFVYIYTKALKLQLYRKYKKADNLT